MSAISTARRRRDVLELMMVTIHFVLTAYLFVSNSPPQIGFVLREAIRPFQMKARARNAGAERSAAAWRLSQFESRARRLSSCSRPWPLLEQRRKGVSTGSDDGSIPPRPSASPHGLASD